MTHPHELTDLTAAATNALRKLRAYVGVCSGDKELVNSIIPKLEAALAATPAVGGELRSLANNIRSKVEQLTHYRDHDCQLDHAKTIADGRILQANQILHWIDTSLAAQPDSPLRTQDDLRRLVDAVWLHATEGAHYPSTKTADMLISAASLSAAPPEQPETKLGSSEPLGPHYDGTTMDNQQLHGTTRRNQPVVTAGETAPSEQPAANAKDDRINELEAMLWDVTIETRRDERETCARIAAGHNGVSPKDSRDIAEKIRKRPTLASTKGDDFAPQV